GKRQIIMQIEDRTAVHSPAQLGGDVCPITGVVLNARADKSQRVRSAAASGYIKSRAALNGQVSLERPQARCSASGNMEAPVLDGYVRAKVGVAIPLQFISIGGNQHKIAINVRQSAAEVSASVLQRIIPAELVEGLGQAGRIRPRCARRGGRNFAGGPG